LPSAQLNGVGTLIAPGFAAQCVPEQMRGRVMSLNTLLIMGVRSLGDPAGALISAIGAPETVLLSAGLVGAYGALLFLTQPDVRSI
jgi:hypothetical protein